MESILLRTKLYIPPLRSEYVLRPRLIASLQEGLQRKLTLLSAPAGFGKSTLLAGWIQQNDIPAGWLSLDEGENDLARFLAYLVAAIQTVNEEPGSGVPNLLSATQLRTAEPALNVLINELSEIEEDFAIVLDDYHRIRSTQVLDTLKYLVEHQPACLHLYLATRVDPPLSLSLLRGRGEMIELRSDELRFNRQESVDFIQRSAGITLSEIDANTLTELTEGWITGIQMAALSIKDRLDVAAFLRDFSGSNRYVLDYLVEEVLETLPEQTQAFLYQTSILERMNGPLCDSMLGDKSGESTALVINPGDGERLLIDLDRQNLFIVPLDKQRHWYRYHHLFADLLRQRLETNQPDLFIHLHKRAAAWYRSEQIIPEAIRHSLACGDFDTAAEMIANIAEEALLRSDFAMFKGWIERLPPDALDQHPRLNSYYLFTSIFSGMPADEVIHQLEVLSELDQENNIQGDILALQALIAVYNGDIHHSAELAEKALNTLPEESIFFRSTIAGFLGFAYMVYGNIQSARRTLEESARVSSQAGNLTMHVLALCHLAEIALLEARIADAEIYYRQVLDMGLDAKGKPRPIVGMALIGLGTLQRERGQLEDAFETLSQGVELVQMWAPSGAVQGYVNLAWIHQLQGDEAAADSALATAAKLALRFQPMEEDDKYVRCHQARMQITRRNPLQALHILSVSPQTTLADLDQAFPALAPERSHSFADLISYIITSSAYFTLEKYDIAERLLSRVRKATQAKGWKRLEMTIMTSLAEIYARCGRKDMALQTLSQPLELAAQEGYVTEFLERGPRLADLLRQALHAGIEPEYVALLLTHIEASDKGVQPASPVERASLVLVEPLSEREFEVLALVAEGYTNAEIGTLLVLSTFTVKKHVSNILGKLGVPSRKLAAERGRELGLI